VAHRKFVAQNAKRDAAALNLGVYALVQANKEAGSREPYQIVRSYIDGFPPTVSRDFATPLAAIRDATSDKAWKKAADEIISWLPSA
jgi:hypothetical protein